eukprot:1245560-Pyramimonas_sp.AAC.1
MLALTFDPVIRGERIGRGLISACAGDLGITLAACKDIEKLFPHLRAAQLCAGLHLQAEKCITAPTWSLPAPTIARQTPQTSERIGPPWKDIK